MTNRVIAHTNDAVAARSASPLAPCVPPNQSLKHTSTILSLFHLNHSLSKDNVSPGVDIRASAHRKRD